MRNIGLSFIRLGQVQDAIQTFETIMESCPDYRTALNLILCYYSSNNKDLMKATFQRMLKIRTAENEKTADAEAENDDDTEEIIVPNDSLRQELRER